MKFCSRNMMETVDLIEDTLSDEYEEGEILDEDIIYENVSSLEEFSDPEDKRLANKSLKSDVKRTKTRRKKEHKCKEDSVCRKERSGKHCYARIRKRSSVDLKLKSSSAKGASLDVEKKSRPAARPVSPTRGNAKRDSSNKDATKGKGKPDDRGRHPSYYSHHDSRDRANPPRRNTSDRRPANTRRFSADDRRESERKRKSQSPSPRVTSKHLHEAKRVVAKTSLLDRLVGSGSIPQKTGSTCEMDDCSTKTDQVSHSGSLCTSEQGTTGVSKICKPGIGEEPRLEDNSSEIDAACQMHNLCPEDIPVPPTPKATSPMPKSSKEEIDELHLRVVALRTAIIKKKNDFRRKKRLAASKKSFSPGNDSFVKFALMGIGDDECDSIPTPPPPGTDCWPPSTARDLDDPKWSDEDMVIDQESNYSDTIIEANVPATDSSLQNYVTRSVNASSPSSQDKLPCCKGNPIPVVSPHRPAKEIEERRTAVSSSNSTIIPIQELPRVPRVVKETPKYLKEINSNLKSSVRKKRNFRRPRPRRRRNSIRQRTPVVRRIEKSAPRKEPTARKSKIFEGDDDEEALRQLALMSVKPKSTITGGMLARIGKNLNPLHIETDPAALKIKPESPAKHSPPPEAWEDLDEDILRAQLLSSLTRNIPVETSQPPLPSRQAIPAKRVVIERNVPLRQDVLTMRLNKENVYTKRNVIVHNNVKTSKRNSKKYINPNVKASSTPPLNHPVIEKFIIRVSESENSEDEDKIVRGKILSDFEATVSQRWDLESSIDKLLEEKRKECELLQKATPNYPMYDGPEVLTKLTEETTSPSYDLAEVKSERPSPVEHSLPSPNTVRDESPIAAREKEVEDSPESPDGTSHLPAWQQEEFERQKRIMAQKESIMAAAKEKIRAKNLAAIENSLKCSDRTDETNTTSIGVTQISEGNSDGSDLKAVEPSGRVVELLEGKRATEDEHSCVLKEVSSSLELLISKVCTEVDAGSVGNAATSESSLELTVSCDLPKSDATPGSDSEIAIGIKSEAAEMFPAAVVPSKNSAKKEPLKPVPAPSNVAGDAVRFPRPQPPQLKKRVLNRISGIQNSLSVATKTASPVRVAPKKPPVRGPAARNLTNSLPNGVAHSAVNKTLLAVKDSSYALKGLSEMTELVASLEKGMSEYANLSKDFIAQRKQLMLTQQKVTKKRQQMLELKDIIENKKRLLQSTISMDTSSLSPLPDNKDQPKQSTKASELLNLKFKEVCLKAQFAMMGLETASRPQAAVKMSRPSEDLNQSPRKRMKLKARPVARTPPKAPPSAKIPTPSESADPGTSHKLVVSVRDSGKMNPLIPLCPFDNKGVCKDEECQYQHLKN